MESNSVTYSIGKTARRIGVCADTLRIWERKGLLNPSRLGKDRLYNRCDLERLQRIKYLLPKKRMNIRGVLEVINVRRCWAIKTCGPEERNKCAVYLNDKGM